MMMGDFLKDPMVNPVAFIDGALIGPQTYKYGIPPLLAEVFPCGSS